MNKKSNGFTFLILFLLIGVNSTNILLASSFNKYPFFDESASLSGKITDQKSNHPLTGASVFIHDLNLGVVSDSSGNYRFKNIPSGNFLIEIKFEGYKSITRTIMVSGKMEHVNFVMEETAAEISEVVVTGSSKATQIRQNPVPIVSISHDYLLTNISTNAIDAIARIPGVHAVTTGPNVSKPFIRGLGYNRILTLYDGIRQEGQQWGDEHGIEVDQYAVNRVEVIKGPASLSYGSDALAGVVNLIPTQPAPEGKMVGDITYDYQTNNKMFGGSGMLSATKNGFEWLARISHKEATNYQNKVDGRVFATAFNETDANATIGLHRKWGYSRLSFVMFDDLQEIPDGSRDSATWKFTRQITEADTVRQIVSDADLNSYKIATLHQHVQHYRLFSSNNFILNNGSRILLNLGIQRSIRREFDHPEIPYQDVAGLFLQLNSLNYDIKYTLRDVSNWDITLGINGMYQENSVTHGTDFVIPSYHQFDIGPFATAKRSFGKLDISGGIRYDMRSFHNDQLYTVPNPVSGFSMPVSGADTVGAAKIFSNYDHTFTGASGSLGATYRLSEKVSLKANISRGFRAPNIAEISANGVHPGTNIYQIGNANFKSEFSLQEDIGLEFVSQYAVIEMNVFNNDINNYIYNQKLIGVNGKDSVIVTGNSTFKFEESRANLFGGEINIDIHPTRFLHFENSLSIVNALNKGAAGSGPVPDSEKYLPQIPPLHGSSELRFDFDSKAFHIRHGFVKMQMEYYSNQNRFYAAYATETRTPGYTLFNAGVGGNFVNRQHKTIFSLYIMANNIFDVTYWDHLSRLKYFYGNYLNPAPNDNPKEHGIYNMGRNISFKLDFPLDFTLKK